MLLKAGFITFPSKSFFLPVFYFLFLVKGPTTAPSLEVILVSTSPLTLPALWIRHEIYHVNFLSAFLKNPLPSLNLMIFSIDHCKSLRIVSLSPHQSMLLQVERWVYNHRNPIKTFCSQVFSKSSLTLLRLDLLATCTELFSHQSPQTLPFQTSSNSPQRPEHLTVPQLYMCYLNLTHTPQLLTTWQESSAFILLNVILMSLPLGSLPWPPPGKTAVFLLCSFSSEVKTEGPLSFFLFEFVITSMFIGWEPLRNEKCHTKTLISNFFCPLGRWPVLGPHVLS